jgi:hypothetical protein
MMSSIAREHLSSVDAAAARCVAAPSFSHGTPRVHTRLKRSGDAGTSRRQRGARWGRAVRLAPTPARAPHHQLGHAGGTSRQRPHHRTCSRASAPPARCRYCGCAQSCGARCCREGDVRYLPLPLPLPHALELERKMGMCRHRRLASARGCAAALLCAALAASACASATAFATYPGSCDGCVLRRVAWEWPGSGAGGVDQRCAARHAAAERHATRVVATHARRPSGGHGPAASGTGGATLTVRLRGASRRVALSGEGPEATLAAACARCGCICRCTPGDRGCHRAALRTARDAPPCAAESS